MHILGNFSQDSDSVPGTFMGEFFFYCTVWSLTLHLILIIEDVLIYLLKKELHFCLNWPFATDWPSLLYAILPLTLTCYICHLPLTFAVWHLNWFYPLAFHICLLILKCAPRNWHLPCCIGSIHLYKKKHWGDWNNTSWNLLLITLSVNYHKYRRTEMLPAGTVLYNWFYIAYTPVILEIL